MPSAGSVAVGGDFVAFVGGSGWKQRTPYLAAGRISGAGGDGGQGGSDEEDESGSGSDRGGGAAGGGKRRTWQQGLKGIMTGFYDP